MSKDVSAVGYVDGVEDGVLYGWCRLENDGQHCHVIVHVDGVQVATGIANRLRPDLVEAGYAHGRSGFAIPLPETVCDGAYHTVRVFEELTKYEILNGEPVRRLPALTQRHIRHVSIMGHVDRVENCVLFGWCHLEDDQHRCHVVVHVDGLEVATGIADIFRQDLVEAGYGDGWSGFAVPLPEEVCDGAYHTVRVTERLSGYELPEGEPVQLLPASCHRDTEGEPWNVLFDAGYYSKAAGTNLDRLHFKKVGYRRPLNPHPLFDVAFYERRYGALTEDPLTSLAKSFAAGEIRTTHALFDASAYALRRPDVRAAGIHPVVHYLREGARERELPSVFFDDAYYEAQCPGVRELGRLPFVHYLQHWQEGRKPHREFDALLFHRLAELHSTIEPYGFFVDNLLAHQKKAISQGAESPKVSIIILNLNKSLMTLQCLFFLRKNTDLSVCELIVVDNGSTAEQFKFLCDFAGDDVTIVAARVNRGFGEGCNIGAERARGDFICFLNNDAFVTEGWLTALIAAMEQDETVGAAGSKLVYANGTLQEAGATISSCGSVVQRGKNLDPTDPQFNILEEVDYCSGAALLVRSSSFHRVLGFDLCWDPAYYEDPDLCLKLRLIEQKTLYVPTSRVIHLENTTAGDPSMNLGLQDIVSVNRLKFVSRWAQYLKYGRDDIVKALIPPELTTKLAKRKPILGLYTPYALTPGGGERYLLSIAAALRDEYDCVLLTPHPYSRFRILTLARELGLALDHVRLAVWEEMREPIELFVSMGNEALPPTPGIGRVNVFLCQFPFPSEPSTFMREWGNFTNYSKIIVYSHFAAEHVIKQGTKLPISIPQIEVLNPPVTMIDNAFSPRSDKIVHILSVGRFFSGGHCKRQDIMIAEFSKLIKRIDRPAVLDLAGSLGGAKEDRSYFDSLRKAAYGLPVRFHLNISPEQLHALFAEASIYWHMTGAERDIILEPHLFEHFGISIIEAMSAGAIPVALKYGGPSEIIRHGIDGVLISTTNELIRETAALLAGEDHELHRLRESTQARAREFSFQVFRKKLLQLIGSLNGATTLRDSRLAS